MQQQIPLAEQLRPANVNDYVGQEHLLGPKGILRLAIESGNLPSMIFWGPPGVGKTTLAYIISQKLSRPFYTLSAINSGVKDVREVIASAREMETTAILFIDEIHRFSKSQQDSLLGAVEKGIVTLIGATTENPSFEVISPLLSRCQVYILNPLGEAELRTIIQRAVNKISETSGLKLLIKEDESLMRISGGDARKLINAIEIIAGVAKPVNGEVVIDNASTTRIIQQNLSKYDKKGEMHYDIISAFIKSMRGSDPNAAVYWLARMIESGEDPLFIARRMLILAAEDIGNANPNALLLANACFDAVHKTGYPECRIILSQCAVYLATSAKSNASYMAIEQAMEMVRKKGDLPVPLSLRNAPTRLMKEIGYGANYKYAHSYQENFVEMDFLPQAITGTRFYNPGNNAREEETRKFLKLRWKDRYNY
ncbi:MAG: replication-associated recombination protein A [Lentimicrobiaceae bacterium]|jgi:putative ATPase|nr:replication-associated recombination protein A [Lentimicrobiaceae bacterium]MDD4598560.1 replication-associated recombination protein A [Lentimicrobiaceae bacterium]MDY0026013.1 replication-associated recombination protein A [Lentimicrobium sp.]